MKPSVGRIVHYWYSSHEGPIAAIITGVNPPGTCGDVKETCDLTLFHSHILMPAVVAKPGIFFAEEPTPGHWNWPPRV